MKTMVKLAVSAYLTSKEMKLEKTASFDVEVEMGEPWGGWNDLVEKLIKQAMGDLEDFPYKVRPMTAKQLERYRAADADPDGNNVTLQSTT